MLYRLFASILASLVLFQAVAFAQSQPGATFTYKMTMGAGAGTGSMDYSMDVAVKSTNADGSRAANVTVHAPKMPPLDKKTLSATLTPFGAITVGSTGEMPKGHFNPYDAGQVKQMAEASTGPMLQMLIGPFNVFANGLASAPSFKNGAKWQVHSNQTMADITYTVTGHERRNGRDTAVIAMTSASSPSVTGRGNYDPAAHLVVAVHCEIRQTPDAKEAQVLDAALTGP